tara:strand:+ start:304 stop:705 length:402 start_codon:yes stop_codon:yes gene_type:complete
MKDAIDVDKLVRVYLKIRDARGELTDKFKQEDKALEEQLDKIKIALLNHCKETNQEGGRTDHGTFTRSIKTRYWTGDWEAMSKFILEHEAVDLLEKRIAQNNMKVFMAEHPDLLPPGLNTDKEYIISVRRKSK